jgi:hypothetical protein
VSAVLNTLWLAGYQQSIFTHGLDDKEIEKPAISWLVQ